MSTPVSSNIFSGKSPEQAWRIVRNEITRRKGATEAFEHQGYSLSYTGPDVAVSPDPDLFIPYAPRISNLSRTGAWVDALKAAGIPAVWLDGSPIGKFLFVDNQLYVGLRDFFFARGIRDTDTI